MDHLAGALPVSASIAAESSLSDLENTMETTISWPWGCIGYSIGLRPEAGRRLKPEPKASTQYSPSSHVTARRGISAAARRHIKRENVYHTDLSSCLRHKVGTRVSDEGYPGVSMWDKSAGAVLLLSPYVR